MLFKVCKCRWQLQRCIATEGRPTQQHFQLNIFWGVESELQINPMPFHLESLWGATLMPVRGCAMDWKRNKILKVSKNSGHILSCLWTKVHEVLGLCRGPLVLSKAFAQLSMSCYVQKIFDIKSRSRRKIEQNVKVFWLPVFGRNNPDFSTADC